jgi:hypothetical protein
MPESLRASRYPTLGGAGGSPCEKIASTAWILCALIRFTFHVFDDVEMGGSQGLDDSARVVKAKLQVDWRAEELIHVDDLVAHMERHQRQPAKHQDLPEPTHDSVELGGLEMYDRIEGDKPDQPPRGEVELPHVPHHELETRMEAGRAPDHLWRDIHSKDRHALIVKVLRNVSGAAAKVGDEPSPPCFLGEPIQEMSVERLLGQLRGHMVSVGVGGRVVAFTNIHRASGESYSSK